MTLRDWFRTIGSADRLFRFLSAAIVAVAAVGYPTKTMAATCDAERMAVNRAKGKLDQHIRAVRGLGFATTADTAEQWSDLTESMKMQAKRYFADGIQDASFALAGHAVQRYGSLNPWNVNPSITWLRQHRMSTPAIEAALRRIAAQSGKPIVRSRLQTELRALQVAVDGARWETSPTTAENILEATRVVLGWLPMSDPRANLSIAGVDFLVSVVYSGGTQIVARPAITRLANMTDQQLRGLGQLSALIQATVRELKVAKKALAACEGRANELVVALQRAIRTAQIACANDPLFGPSPTRFAIAPGHACDSADWAVSEAEARYCASLGKQQVKGDRPAYRHDLTLSPEQYPTLCK